MCCQVSVHDNYMVQIEHAIHVAQVTLSLETKAAYVRTDYGKIQQQIKFGPVRQDQFNHVLCQTISQKSVAQEWSQVLSSGMAMIGSSLVSL
jgi:hypothetical protein